MKKSDKVLGLDIGVASVGWCLIEREDEVPVRILGSGSRIFSPGVEGDFANGKDESTNQKRASAKQARRQLWRRRRRMLKLYRTLVRLHLLPDAVDYNTEGIDRALKALDCELMSREIAANPVLLGDRRSAQVFYHRLRARAADGRVDANELGRALYHLAQHRGYLSNRVSKKKDGEEEGEVAVGIEGLKSDIAKSGLPTLGAYFASLDPEVERVRDRWLGRKEFILPEFDAIKRAQLCHQHTLREEDWKEIHDAIFRQRPLKDQSHLIGKCSLEVSEVRCPVAYPLAQRFRILQAVNHLRVVEVDGETQRAERPLTPAERLSLIKELEGSGDLTFPAARKLLKLSTKTVRFSIELGGETKLIGNRTSSTMRVAIGAKWDAFDEEKQDRVIDDVLEYESQDALATRCERSWGLTKDEAKTTADVTLESARLNLSLRAIKKMLPHLEKGLSVQEAKVAAYPQHAGVDEPWDFLPPILPDRIWRKHCSNGRPYNGIEIRNPAVERSLTEVRKVVNAVIRRWGKPDLVRIELARDLKKPRKEREDESKRSREQETRRESAVLKMAKEGFPEIADRRRRNDVEKVLLWEECGGICPYTGRSIAFEALFGPSPQFEVEHIIPYSLCLEDGFGNKTLCEVNENRTKKRQNSPFDAYHGTSKWDGIIGRVRHFKSRSASKKLRLFESQSNGSEIFGDFTERQLNDTRCASRLALEYLGLLFGAQIDLTRKRRVQASAGGATATIRRKLGMERVLGSDGEKNRKDHRHHAVDAIAIALTGPREVQAIARASEAAVLRGEASHRLKIDPPWPEFIADVTRSIDGIIVSHRANRRLSGALHQETNYSRPIKDAHGKVARSKSSEGLRHIRKSIESLSVDDVRAIADHNVRMAVEQKLASIGEPKPEKAFKGGERLPTMRHGDGRDVPIRRVRIKVNKTLDAVGSGGATRHIAPGSNHHMAVIEILGTNGKVLKRELEVVTMLEAFRRRQRHEPIVQQDWGEGRRLAFTLRSRDMVEMELDGVRVLCVIGSVSDGLVEMKLNQDARPSSEIKKAGVQGGRLKFSTKGLLGALRRKIEIQALGSTATSNE